MVDISIIIVNYKVKDYIIPCIDSIYQSIGDRITFEIIVVDNDSNDGSVEAIQARYPQVIQLHNQHNIGFSKGVNQGAEIAKGEFIFILNPDTVMVNGIESILKTIQDDQQIGAVGPKMTDHQGKVQQSYWQFPTLFNSLLSILHLDWMNHRKNYKNKTLHEASEVDTLSGGALLTRSNLFHDNHGFDPNLFWMEDIDYCYRLKKKGYQIIYFTDARVTHHQGKSARQNYQVAVFNQLISKVKYFTKHGTKFDQLGISVGVFLISVLKLGILIWFTPIHKQYRAKVRGYWSTIKWLISR